MSASARPSIATHYLRYTIGNALILLAGFVSYPVLTRLLSNAEYGVFGYFDAWMLMLTAVIKLGSQHSTLRFYPHGGDSSGLARYGATFVLFSFAVSCGIWLLAAIVLAVLTALGRVSQPVGAWIMLVLLLPTVCISYVNAVLTAEERSNLSVFLSVGQRWGDVFTILGIVYFVSRTASGVYAARLVSASVIAAIGVAWLLRHLPMHWRDRDVKHWLEGVRYGVPMGANEVAYIVLGFVDRLMLKQQLHDFVPVGIYTIGYGLALNINTMLHAGLGVAYNQVSIRLYETKGPQAVVQTKRTVLDILVYVVAALIVGTIVVGPDLLLLLSGHDKFRSAPVFVGVTVTYVLSGLLGLCASGLVLHKRSGTIFALTVVAAAVNILLNWFWILWLHGRRVCHRRFTDRPQLCAICVLPAGVAGVAWHAGTGDGVRAGRGGMAGCAFHGAVRPDRQSVAADRDDASDAGRVRAAGAGSGPRPARQHLPLLEIPGNGQPVTSRPTGGRGEDAGFRVFPVDLRVVACVGACAVVAPPAARDQDRGHRAGSRVADRDGAAGREPAGLECRITLAFAAIMRNARTRHRGRAFGRN
jgi:O-antigen/teichoic acid export membrane protein